MPTLVVRPIVLSAVGSYRERKRYLRLLRKLREVSAAKDADAVLATLEEADELLVSRLATDDGSPVDAALDLLSAQQFDQLLSAIAFEGGLGEVTSAPSTTPSEGANGLLPT